MSKNFRLKIKPAVLSGFLVLALAGWLAGAAMAQTGQTQPKETLEKAAKISTMAFSEYFTTARPEDFMPQEELKSVVDEDYIIGPGDQIDVMVWGQLQGYYALEVAWDGNLMPLTQDQKNVENFFTFWPGSVSVSGKTLKELQFLMDKSFQAHIKDKNLKVTIKVTQPRRLSVQIMGQVNFPNEFKFPAGITLVSALRTAGYNDNTSLRRIVLIRKEASGKLERYSVDLYKYFVFYDLSSNPILQNGDIVQIPFVDTTAVADGAVNVPAKFEMLPGEKISDLLDFAFGPSWNAAATRSYIEFYGGNEHITMKPLDISFYENKKFDDPANVVIKNGDSLFVEQVSNVQSYVEVIFDNLFGEYEEIIQQQKEHQQIIPLADGMTLGRLLTRLKGNLTNAELSNITIVRGGEKLFANYMDILAVPENDILLKSGDVIYVPKAVNYVYVLGEVRSPSMIKYGRDATILEYIAQAGGYQTTAKLAIVTVLHTAKGNQTKELVDVKEWIKYGTRPKNAYVLPGDIIIVPKDSSFKYQDFVQIFNTTVPILTLLKLIN